MRSRDVTEVLGGGEGYRVGFARRCASGQGGSGPQILSELIRKPGLMVCSGCGRACSRYHDCEERCIRDLPILDAETELWVQRFRVACPSCRPKVEELPWLDNDSRVTKRLAASVARLCQVLSIKQVAEFYGLGWDAVKAMDKAWLKATLAEPDWTTLEFLAMDELAVKRAHPYPTIFVEPHRKEVLWICCGRSRQAIRPFFEKVGAASCRQIKAVAMDMSAAYEAEVKFQRPSADIVYDFFHVVATYGREVIDHLGTAEANRQVIQGSRWLPLRNSVNLKRQDRVRLRELLAVNRRPATVYVLKDHLKTLWDYRSPHWAMQFFRDWYARAIRSRIQPLNRFATQLPENIDGVLSHCEYPLHTSLLEGINNKIKVTRDWPTAIATKSTSCSRSVQRFRKSRMNQTYLTTGTLPPVPD